MSKTWETKQKILDMLKTKRMTLSEISDSLSLAPSTVSQHIKELLRMGAIKEVDNPFIKKWKYYEPNVAFNVAEVRESSIRQKLAMPISAIAAIIIILMVYLTVRGTYVQAAQLSINSQVPVGSTVFSISDAPPSYNISAVYINISSVAVHSITTGKWYKLPLESGTVNIMELQNLSKAVSIAYLPHGNYNVISFGIRKATATVNGTNQSIIVPSDILRIFEPFNVSDNTTNWVNIDFNLARSLHIASNGKIVMIPVINMMYMNGGRLSIEGNQRIGIISMGHAREFIVGMNKIGVMEANQTVPQNVSIEIASNGKMKILPSNSLPIIVRGSRCIIIGSHVPYSASNATIAIPYPNGQQTKWNSSIQAQCHLEKSAIICNLNSTSANVSSVMQGVISAISNTSWQHGYPVMNLSVGEERLSIGAVHHNASAAIFSCTNSNQCALVPVTVCQNGMPSQSICINNSYYSEYMMWYSELRQSTHAFCPMFIMRSNLGCACISNYCVETYSLPKPIPMPQ